MLYVLRVHCFARGRCLHRRPRAGAGTVPAPGVGLSTARVHPSRSESVRASACWTGARPSLSVGNGWQARVSGLPSARRRAPPSTLSTGTKRCCPHPASTSLSRAGTRTVSPRLVICKTSEMSKESDQSDDMLSFEVGRSVGRKTGDTSRGEPLCNTLPVWKSG